MGKNIFVILINFSFVVSLFSQEKLLINTYNRQNTSLNGMWNYIVDPYENGFYNYRYEPFENSINPSRSAFFMNSKPISKSDLIEYDFNKSDSINVPGDWNTQKENLYYYEGTIWYKKSFNYSKKKSSNHVFVYFGASNYETDVYLNGKKLGKHIGGFTPFNFEITNLLKEKENFLVVKVDNKRKPDGVPTLNTDWWNYGGITRDIKIVETSQTFIQDYFIQLSPKNKHKIKGYIQLNGNNIENQSIKIVIPILKLNEEVLTNNNGFAKFEFEANDITYWSTDNPFLYNVKIKTNEEELTDQIGFRSIKTKGNLLLLNDKPIFLISTKKVLSTKEELIPLKMLCGF